MRRMLVVMLLTGLAPAWGATLVVPAGDPDALAETLARAQAGDVVELAGGVYVGGMTLPDVGTEGAPLTIRATEGSRAVIDAHGDEYGVQIAPEAGWVVLEGLIVVRARSFGLYARPAHDLVVRGCTFARNGDSGLYLREVDGAVIERCVFHHNRDDGAAFRGVSSLRVADCMSYLHPAAPGSSENFGIYVSGCAGAIIERNALFLNDKSGCRIVNSPDGNTVRDNCTYLNGWTGFDINSRSHQHLYVNNLMINNLAHGINPKGYSHDNRFVNNTIVGNRANAITVNNRAHDNLFRNNLLLGSPAGFSYDTRVEWSQRNSDHNVFDMPDVLGRTVTLEMARELGLEAHSVVQPVEFATDDPFDFALPDESPLHEVAEDVGFGQVMGAPDPVWRGPRLLPAKLTAVAASGNLEDAGLTVDGDARTTWNSGVTEEAWIEYEIEGDLPGPLGFVIICPTISTALPGGDIPGAFTIRAGGEQGEALYDGELFCRKAGLARGRGQCFEFTRTASPEHVRLELHTAADANYNGIIEPIHLTEVMLIAALDSLPESLAEFPYDEVAPVPASVLQTAREVRENPAAPVAPEEGLLLHLPFEDLGPAAYARGDGDILFDGAELLPGLTGRGLYLVNLSGTVCNLAAKGNVSADAGTISMFFKPLVPWNSRTVGGQNFQFLATVHPTDDRGRFRQGDEIRLAYVSGGFQVVGGVVYNGPQEYMIGKRLDLEAGRWYHVVLCWSKAASETVLYLDGEEIGRAGFGADFAADGGLAIGVYGNSLQPMAVLDEVKVFDRALEPDEVQDLTIALPPSPTNNP